MVESLTVNAIATNSASLGSEGTATNPILPKSTITIISAVGGSVVFVGLIIGISVFFRKKRIKKEEFSPIRPESTYNPFMSSQQRILPPAINYNPALSDTKSIYQPPVNSNSFVPNSGGQSIPPSFQQSKYSQNFQNQQGYSQKYPLQPPVNSRPYQMQQQTNPYNYQSQQPLLNQSQVYYDLNSVPKNNSGIPLYPFDPNTGLFFGSQYATSNSDSNAQSMNGNIELLDDNMNSNYNRYIPDPYEANVGNTGR